MLTVLLEVKNNQSHNTGFYNPAVDGFIKYPRTEKGLKKAIAEMVKTIQKTNWISEYRFKIYQGKYEYWKNNMQPLCIIDSEGIVTELNK